MKAIYLKSTAALACGLLLASCSKQDEPAVVEESSQNAESTQSELTSSFSKGLEDVKKSIDDSKDKLAAELASKLEAQKSQLVSEFSAQNSALANQLDELKSQYNKLSETLPAEVATQIEAKLPEILSSLQHLQEIVKTFNPESIEQVDAFKKKYEKELGLAQELVGQSLALMKAADIKLPKF